MTSRSDEDGFTLIELVIATTVLGVIMSTIVLSLVLFLVSTGETTERLAESPEAQIASVYLTRDAQSAEVTNVTCGSPWAGATHLVSFGWRDQGLLTALSDNRAFVVSYVVAAASGNPSQKELRRYECTSPLSAVGATISSVAAPFQRSTVVSLVDPSVAPTASTTTDVVNVAFAICTAKTGAPTCNNGTSLPFTLSVNRRVG
jgi:prepilin-type N-terminal cleavage/methylation domain-containing protein